MAIDLPTVGGSRNQWGTWTNEILIRRGIDPTWSRFGLSATNTEAANATAWANADAYAAETGDYLRLPDGEYPFAGNAAITCAAVEGRGSDRTILTRSTGGGTPTLSVSGTLGTAAALASDASIGSVTLTTATTPGLAAGDLALVTSSRTVGTSAGAVGYELVWIASVASTTVTLATPLLRSFTTANGAAIKKVTPARPRIGGIGMVFSGAAATDSEGVKVSYGRDVRLEDIAGSDYDTRVAHLRSCVDSRLSGIRADDPTSTASGKGYGLQIAEGSRNVTVEGVAGRGNRHLVVIAHAASFVTVRGGHASGGTAGDFDVHGQECRFVTFDDCHGDGTGPTFNIGNDSYGPDYEVSLIRCGANTSGVGYPVVRCFNGSARIDIDGLMVDGGYAALWADGCADITIRGGHTRGNTYGVYGNDTTGVKIDGLVIHGATTNAVKSEGTSDNWSILGADYVGCAAGSSLVGASNTTANVKTR